MSSILNFFKPTNKNTTSVPNVPIDVDLDKSSVDSPSTKKRKLEIVTSDATDASRNTFPNDIANFCRKNLNDIKKYEVLMHYWIPDIDFKFPTSGKRNLKFQHSWLRSFVWLVYSAAKDGAYCRYCVSFGSNYVGKGGHQNINVLVQTAFRDWKKALEKFREHQTKKYHLDAMEDGQNFKLIYENRKNDVISEIDKGRKMQLLENRQKLIPIIRAVLLCGRQGLPLRGHRDQGSLSLKMPEENDGNFRALLRYALDSGDQILANHLNTAGSNATYLSFRIQNEIIDAAGKQITTNIVQRVNRSGCFSVIADESTDVSGIEQFSICVRFIDKIDDEYIILEDFLCFIPVEDVTGKGLANTLLTKMKDIGINLVNMRGQGYDGARAMSGKFNGCAAKVRELYPEAIYVHCANHNLNLAITHACKISSIRNCIGTIKEVVNLFRLSNKAGLVLKDKIKASCPSANQTRLLKFCETRWVEHLDSLSLFNDVYEHICSSLEYLDENNLKTDGIKPHALLSSIQTPQFIIALTVVKPIFIIMKNLSIFLQKEDCDLSLCIDYANNVYDEINEMRRDSELKFKDLFVAAKEMAEKMSINLVPPRNILVQKNRDNYEGSPEAYFRRSIFLSFLDHLSMQLKTRFIDHRELLSKIQNILPIKCSELNTKEISETVNTFAKEWPNDIKGSTDDFIAEMTMWCRHCLNMSKDKRPKTFIDTLNTCDSTLYQSIHRFLQIGATLPVSVATSERSFSCLRRLKTYLRNKTGEERLNGLMLLNLYRDVEVTYDEIINIMAKVPRRLDLIL